MATMNKAKHAFGTLEGIDQAIADGKIDSYDVLFVKDANGKPFIGWIDKDGQKIICDDSAEFAELEAQIASKADAYEIESLQTEIATKVDASVVQTMIDEAAVGAIEVIEF